MRSVCPLVDRDYYPSPVLTFRLLDGESLSNRCRIFLIAGFLYIYLKKPHYDDPEAVSPTAVQRSSEKVVQAESHH